MRLVRLLVSVFAVLSLSACLDIEDSHYRFPCDGLACSEADSGRPAVDAGARDAGDEAACSVTCTAPAAYCADTSTLVTPRVRACTGASCQFESSSVPCSQGCAAGACVNEPCAGVVCSSPPAPMCASASVLRVFVSPGACSGGTCGYASADVACNGGCAAGACVGNPCAGKTCDLPPAASCVGNVLRTYPAQGVCNGATGICSYERIDTVCAAGCANAACIADPCSGVVCSSPPAPTCLSSLTRQYFITSGVCSGGSCSYVAMTETCAGDTRCQGGQCQTPAPSCNASNCAGCCTGTSCVPISGQSASSCGLSGNTCLACSSGFTCSSGACADVNECQVNNGGCNVNAQCANTAGGRTCGCKPGYFGDGLSCAPVADGGVPAWVMVRDGGSAADPEPRRGAAMAFDAERGAMVLFGGYDGVSHFDDTWTWNGTTWSYRNVAGPSARRIPTMAYDSNRKKVVLFGGYNTVVTDDTWEWNGTSWAKLTPTSSPPPMYGAGVAYDSVRKKVVLFGGQSGSLEYNQTWEWDGTTWEQRTPAIAPAARFSPSMAFDSVRNVVVLYGGTLDGSVASGETWEYDGLNWSLRATTGPSARYGAIAGFLGGRTVIFGGYDYQTYFDETWEWNGTAWLERSTPVSPSGRFFHAGAVDSARGKLVLFGGVPTNASSAYLRDTWVFGP